MPSTYFFATKADLIPGLSALQRERPLQFVRCGPGGGVDGPTAPTLHSLLDATDLDHLQFRSYPNRDYIDRMDLTAFIVCDADVSIEVEEEHLGSALPGGGKIHYRARMPTPSLVLIPGGLHGNPRVLWQGDIQVGYEDAEDLRFYRQIVDTLFQGFQRFGGDFYGPEALSLGMDGVLYTHLMHAPYKPWTYSDLFPSGEQAPSPVNKPETGRLSLRKSWDWLEAEGYDVYRRADGTPDPYTRRPTPSSNPDRGFSFYRTALDEFELDHLTIPRTYIAKSRNYQTSFRQSNLSRSRFAANTFAFCDFRETDLSGSLLADFYLHCTFDGAMLKDADLRWSGFEECTFTGANMIGTKLRKEQAAMLTLSEAQRAVVVWHEDTDLGPEVGEL